MRRTLLRAAGVLLVLGAMASVPPLVQAQEPICPLCIIGYKCCIKGGQATCIPESRPCH